MDAKIIKLQEIEKRYLEINDLLMQEENASDVKKYTKLSKEQASLRAACIFLYTVCSVPEQCLFWTCSAQG